MLNDYNKTLNNTYNFYISPVNLHILISSSGEKQCKVFKNLMLT